MASVNASKPTLIDLPYNQVILLDNVTCVFCGDDLTEEILTKEHIIARNFVPRGKFQGCWNLIVNACSKCNGEKAELEDDISAITLQPDAFGRHSHQDETGAAEAQRKARAKSRRTGLRVSDSHEDFTVDLPFNKRASVSVKLTAPPQADRHRVFELARLQLVGFFYWISYNKSTRRGGWWPGGFHPLLQASHSDWGNPQIRAFADAVVKWEPRVSASTADGFYKIAVRRHPTAECWSWALEWNNAKRVVGFFGDRQEAEAIVSTLPMIGKKPASIGVQSNFRYREEMPFIEEEDRLFYWDDATE